MNLIPTTQQLIIVLIAMVVGAVAQLAVMIRGASRANNTPEALHIVPDVIGVGGVASTISAMAFGAGFTVLVGAVALACWGCAVACVRFGLRDS